MAPPHPSDAHSHWMRRAIRLAMNGRGRVEPNPMVGCVIVAADGSRVLGEGFHEVFGGPHAEPNALAACAAAGASPVGATVYTTLEPCCQTNKKTPPCVPRLIEAKVGRIVIGCLDPDPNVNGRGAQLLRQAGIEVTAPVLEPECKQLIAPFIARTVHQRPYVTLKWGETADRKVAGPGGKRMQITGLESQRLVHELRARSDAILVGRRTLHNDDPLLTARGVPHARPLTRIILGRKLDVPITAAIHSARHQGQLIVCCSQEEYDREIRSFLRLYSGFNVSALPLPEDPKNGGLSLRHLLSALGRTTITHLLVEPGPITAESFIRQNLPDRIWLFRSPDVMNDPTAPTAAQVPYSTTSEIAVGRDKLSESLNLTSPMFFAREPSADFVLAIKS